MQALKGVESINQLTAMMEKLQKQSGAAGRVTPPAELGGGHVAGAGADPGRGAGDTVGGAPGEPARK